MRHIRKMLLLTVGALGVALPAYAQTVEMEGQIASTAVIAVEVDRLDLHGLIPKVE